MSKNLLDVRNHREMSNQSMYMWHNKPALSTKSRNAIMLCRYAVLPLRNAVYLQYCYQCVPMLKMFKLN